VRPVISMITDRRRPPSPGGLRRGFAPEDALVERVGAAARAGVHLIQIREHDLDGRLLARLAERCLMAVEGTEARVLVNDRLDVALAAGAHGVHLRGDSAPASRLRAVVSRSFVIGRSIHAREETGPHAEAIDYFVFGSVFETGSKPGAVAAGARMLGEVAGATTRPVLAVGGVTVERCAQVAHAGAAGFAAIGLFADCPIDALQVIVRAASAAFDTPGSVP